MSDTITVWVSETDDGWAVNTHDEMFDTFCDHINQINDIWTVTVNGNEYDFEPADTLEQVDPEGFRAEFRQWREEGWTELEIPVDIRNTEAEQAWVNRQMR